MHALFFNGGCHGYVLALMTEVGSHLSAARTALSAVNEKPKFRKTSAEVFSKLQPKFLPEVLRLPLGLLSQTHWQAFRSLKNFSRSFYKTSAEVFKNFSRSFPTTSAEVLENFSRSFGKLQPKFSKRQNTMQNEMLKLQPKFLESFSRSFQKLQPKFWGNFSRSF